MPWIRIHRCGVCVYSDVHACNWFAALYSFNYSIYYVVKCWYWESYVGKTKNLLRDSLVHSLSWNFVHGTDGFINLTIIEASIPWHAASPSDYVCFLSGFSYWLFYGYAVPFRYI